MQQGVQLRIHSILPEYGEIGVNSGNTPEFQIAVGGHFEHELAGRGANGANVQHFCSAAEVQRDPSGGRFERGIPVDAIDDIIFGGRQFNKWQPHFQ